MIRDQISQLNPLIDAAIHLNSSNFIREAVSERSVSVKVIEYRDVGFEAAKKEVTSYFKMKGEAWASDASSDLQIDYDIVCRIMDELEREGKLEPVK